MIPFLPEDAVVDNKKKDTYTSTESVGAVYNGLVQSQGFSPPASFVGK
jgi:Na+(H+)/acetate symporter ActP